MLGEQGYVGLFVFLMLGWIAWRTAHKIMKLTRNSEEHKWAYDLASMIQVGYVGYAVGGAFLGLSYFDLPYHFLAILVLTLRIVEQSLATHSQTVVTPKHPHLISPSSGRRVFNNVRTIKK